MRVSIRPWIFRRFCHNGKFPMVEGLAGRRRLEDQPLPRAWLQRARRSRSAEPMREPVYRQAPLTPATWQKLQQHPQFK